MKTRMALAEDKLGRLESEQGDQGKRITAIEFCINGIPRIEKALEEFSKETTTQLKYLNECKIANEATAKAKVSWLESPVGKLVWDLARATIIGVIAWAALVNQHVILAGGA